MSMPAMRKRNGFTLIELCLGLVIAGALAGIGPLRLAAFMAAGYSLIELCVVMIIVGLLTAAFFKYLDVSIKEKQRADLKAGVVDINSAIVNFLNKNGRLPCPAPENAAPGDAVYGHEAACDGAAHGGTALVSGRKEGGVALKVRIGSLPTRDLNIPDLAMLDPYGRRYSYAVTEKLADADTGNDPAEGAIEVKDEKDKSVLSSPGIARYVVFSHGPDGKGAYALEGGQYAPCDAARLDGKNCAEADAVFITTVLTSDADSSGHYDDYLSYSTVQAPKQSGGGCPLYCADNGSANLCYLTPGNRNVSVPAGKAGMMTRCVVQNLPTAEKGFPAGTNLTLPLPGNGRNIQYGEIVDPAQYNKTQTCPSNPYFLRPCATGAELPLKVTPSVITGSLAIPFSALGNCGDTFSLGNEVPLLPEGKNVGVVVTCGNDDEWHTTGNAKVQYDSGPSGGGAGDGGSF
jgi:prepilin-type N-terminal cleavage/methylation domain-containing protein